MFGKAQDRFINLQDVEVILNSLKQVMSIRTDKEFYLVQYGNSQKNATIKIVIKDNAIASQELLNVYGVVEY